MIFFIAFLSTLGAFILAGLVPRPASEHIPMIGQFIIVIGFFGGIVVMFCCIVNWLFSLTF